MRTPRLPGHRPSSGSPGKRAPHGPDGGRGPLERSVDRLERRLRVFLTALAVLALLLAVWGSGLAVYSHYAHVRQT